MREAQLSWPVGRRPRLTLSRLNSTYGAAQYRALTRQISSIGVAYINQSLKWAMAPSAEMKNRDSASASSSEPESCRERRHEGAWRLVMPGGGKREWR